MTIDPLTNPPGPAVGDPPEEPPEVPEHPSPDLPDPDRPDPDFPDPDLDPDVIEH